MAYVRRSEFVEKAHIYIDLTDSNIRLLSLLYHPHLEYTLPNLLPAGLYTPRIPPRRPNCVLMFQSQFTIRLCSIRWWYTPISRSIVQICAKLVHVMKVGRNNFYPPPLVESSIARITLVTPGLAISVDEWDGLVMLCFVRKNKTFRRLFEQKWNINPECQARSDWSINEFSHMLIATPRNLKTTARFHITRATTRRARCCKLGQRLFVSKHFSVAQAEHGARVQWLQHNS